MATMSKLYVRSSGCSNEQKSMAPAFMEIRVLWKRQILVNGHTNVKLQQYKVL